MARRVLDVRTADELGALDPDAVERVREEAWPRPADLEEVHEALLWMGYVTVEEGQEWQTWLDELARAGRVRQRGRPVFCHGGVAGPEGRPSWPPGSARPGLQRRSAAPRAGGRGLRPARRGSMGGRRGATAGCSPASSATRSTDCGARSSPSPPPSSCGSSAAGSTSRRSTSSRGRAAWRRWCASSRASRRRRAPGRRASCRGACARTSGNGSIRSRSPARSPGCGSGAPRTSPVCAAPRLPS